MTLCIEKVLDNLINIINIFINDFNTYELNNSNDIKKYQEIKSKILYFNTIFNQLEIIYNNSKKVNNIITTNFNINILKLLNKKYINKINNNDDQINIKLQTIVKNTDFNSNTVKEINILNKKNINNTITDIPVIYVNTENEIKNTEIYYIKTLDQFAIKINNKLIKGNIGNIYSKKELKKKDNLVKNIIKCKYTNCDNINCKYYHDKNVNTNFKSNNYYIRNFLNHSWNYIQTNKLKQKNNNSINRFIGSRDTLFQDLIYINNDEIELREHQLMHDLLTYQIINNYNNIYNNSI